MIDDYFSDILSEDISAGKEDNYKRTIALRMLLSGVGVDGFMCPSIANKLHSVNLCLFPSVADARLCPVGCHVYKMTPTDKAHTVYDASALFTATSIESNGDINWIEARRDLMPGIAPFPWWDLRHSR
jgi:hypothetical protein